jgi:hypothetical protein
MTNSSVAVASDRDAPENKRVAEALNRLQHLIRNHGHAVGFFKFSEEYPDLRRDPTIEPYVFRMSQGVFEELYRLRQKALHRTALRDSYLFYYSDCYARWRLRVDLAKVAKSPNADLRLKTDPPTRLVAIQHYGSSGSYFLSSLFDRHPQVLAVPFGIQRSPLAFEWFLGGKFPVQAWLGIMLIAPVYAGVEMIQNNYDEQVKIPRNDFFRTVEIILRSFGLTPSSMITTPIAFYVMHLAYCLVKDGHPPAKVSSYVFQLHTPGPDKFNFVKRHFADRVLLAMVREPKKALASHCVNSCLVSGPPYSKLLLNSLGQMIKGGPMPEGEPPERCLAVQLDALKAAPEDATRHLARFLGIDWDPCFLESTVNGQPFVYKGPTGSVSGMSSANLKRDYSSWFSRFDLFRIRFLFRIESRKWGYGALHGYDNPIAYAFCALLLRLPFKTELIDFKAAFVRTPKDLVSGYVKSVKAKLRVLAANYVGLRRLMAAKHAECRKPEAMARVMAPLFSDPGKCVLNEDLISRSPPEPASKTPSPGDMPDQNRL